jgi:hypothetical protein
MQSKSGNKSTQPSTGRRAATSARIRSLIRKNLVANPDFPGIYAEVLESEGHNFNEAKDLAIQLQKKLGVYKPQRAVPTCSHIMVTGVPCQSPALRGEQFCYFHQRMLAGVALPRKRLNHIALLENEEAIQVSIMEVVNGLITGSLDPRRGELVLRALNTAVRNSRRVRFNINAGKMVTEVPHYEAEAEARERSREEVRAEIARMRTAAAQHIAGKVSPEKVSPEKSAASSSAAAPAPVATAQAPAPQQQSVASISAPDVTGRKPPLGVKDAATARHGKVATAGASSS